MNRKFEIVMSIILILVVLGVSVKIYISSKEYDCEKCIITFKHKRILQEDYQEVNSSVIKLYEGYINDKCPIFWDYTNGYMKHG